MTEEQIAKMVRDIIEFADYDVYKDIFVYLEGEVTPDEFYKIAKEHLKAAGVKIT